jgi:hypothetical protein
MEKKVQKKKEKNVELKIESKVKSKSKWDVYQEYYGSNFELLESSFTLKECVKFAQDQYQSALEATEYLPSDIKKVPIINQPKDMHKPFESDKKIDFAFFKVSKNNDFNYLYKDFDDSQYLLYCVKIGSDYWKNIKKHENDLD